MPNIVVGYTIPEGQTTGEAFDVVRALIAEELAAIPNVQSHATDQSWEHKGNSLTGALSYKLGPDEEPGREEEEGFWDTVKAVVFKSCEAVKGDGEVCGRTRPCKYHNK